MKPKRKLALVTIVLILVITAGGLIFYSNKDKADKHYHDVLTQIEQSADKLAFDDALKMTNSALEDTKKDPKLESYKTQLEETIKLEESAKDDDNYVQTEEIATTIIKHPDLLNGVEKVVRDHLTSLTTDKKELKTFDKLTITAQDLAQKEKYEESNKALEPILAKESSGMFKDVVTQATTLKASNDAAIQKSNEEANKTITVEEALAILKSNLPDYFDNPLQTWVELPDTSGHDLAFSGMTDGSGFRGSLYLDAIDAKTVSVKLESGSSTSPTVSTQAYTFSRLTDNSVATKIPSKKKPSESQKYLDAYAEYSAKGINVLPYNRGSGVLLPEDVAKSGLSEKQLYQYQAGIEDYFGKKWQDGELTKEEFESETLKAKDKLYNGDFAANNDTFPDE